MRTLSLFDRPPGPGGEDAEDRVFRVSELNRAVRSLLEEGFADLWVEGELSDVTRAASGHVYFTLNDGSDPAQLRGVMFRGDAGRAKARLENGARVRVKGTLSLYEPRGAFQLIARLAVPAGEGLLLAEFERLRKKLDAEGLFAPERKRPLPLLPRTVGIVTSESGAALHDVLEVAAGRCPTRFVVADCRVQGEGAAESIVRALERVQAVAGLEVVIVTRGGGAAEDLWAFNDERVVRAIAACRVPVVSGVGHEVDTTLADLVADVRAATPSNAAERVVPDRESLLGRVEGARRHLEQAMETRLGRARLRLEKFERLLGDPRRAVLRVRARFEDARHALEALLLRRLARARAGLADRTATLREVDPRHVLAGHRAKLADLDGRLRGALAPALARRRAAWSAAAAKLSALSPLEVLARGYAIALTADGRAVRDAGALAPGSAVRVRVALGAFDATVTRALPASAVPREHPTP